MAHRPTIIRDMAMQLRGGRTIRGTQVDSRPGMIGPEGRVFTLHISEHPDKVSGPLTYRLQASIPRGTIPKKDLSHEIKVALDSKDMQPPQVLPQEVADHVRWLASHWEGHAVDQKAVLQHDGKVWRFVKPKEKT